MEGSSPHLQCRTPNLAYISNILATAHSIVTTEPANSNAEHRIPPPYICLRPPYPHLDRWTSTNDILFTAHSVITTGPPLPSPNTKFHCRTYFFDCCTLNYLIWPPFMALCPPNPQSNGKHWIPSSSPSPNTESHCHTYIFDYCTLISIAELTWPT